MAKRTGKLVQVWLSEEEHSAFCMQAEASGSSVTRYAKQCLERSLAPAGQERAEGPETAPLPSETLPVALLGRLDALERNILDALAARQAEGGCERHRDEAAADSDGQAPARPRQQVVYAHTPVNAHTPPSCIAGLPYRKPMKRIGEL